MHFIKFNLKYLNVIIKVLELLNLNCVIISSKFCIHCIQRPTYNIIFYLLGDFS
jgi:hypothetical protein